MSTAASATRSAGFPSRDLTQGPIARTLLLFALPVLGANVLQSLNGSVNAIWLGNLLGEEALTASSNANLVLFLLLGAVFGVSMAATILVAQAMGARDTERAKCVVSTGTTFFVDRHVLGLFLPGDSSAVSIAVHINDIAGWSFVLFGVTIVLFGVVRATGAVMPPLLILFVAMLVVRVPFAWALRERFGAEAVWWSFPLGALVSTALALAYYRYGGWRGERLAPEEPATGEAADTGVAVPAMDREPLLDAPAEPPLSPAPRPRTP